MSIFNVGLAAEIEAHVKTTRRALTIGLAGAGQMGTDIVVQLSLMSGVVLGAISEIRVESARDAALMSGLGEGDIVSASSASGIDRAIEMVKQKANIAASEKITPSANPAEETRRISSIETLSRKIFM